MSRRLITIFAFLLLFVSHAGAGAAVLDSDTDYPGMGDWVGTADADTMTNNKGVTINGGILALGGDDKVILEGGPGSYAGVVDGGAGIDEIVYGGGAWTYGHASIVNFEKLSINATADLALNGAWDLANGIAQVSGGSLIVNDSLDAGGLTISGGTAAINGLAVISGTVSNQGTLSVASGGSLNTGSLDNAGLASIEGNVTITGAVNNSGGLDVIGSLTAGSLNNSRNLGVTGSLNSGSLVNTGGVGVGGFMRVGSLINRGGLGVGRFLTADSLINSGGVGVGGFLNVGSLVNSGALGVGMSLVTGSLVNSGNLAVGGALTAGSLVNSGNLAVGGFMNVGSLINNGDLPVGGLLITGSLVNSGFLPVGGTLIADSLNNSGTLDVGGSLSAGSLINSGELIVSVGGSLSVGRLINSGNAFIDGKVAVSGAADNSGSLIVNGTLTTASLANSGYIGGAGEICADIITTGIIAPGNSIGTLTVTGSVVFDAGSSLVAELGNTSLCDRLKVSGPVTINSGSISTAIPRDLYANGFSWRIITSGQGVSGLFDSIDNRTKSAVLSLAQANTGDALGLVISRKSYGSFAGGGAADTGRGLDDLVPLAQGELANLLVAMDFDLGADRIAGVVNALNPEMYTAFSAASLNTGRLFDKIMGLRLKERSQRRPYPQAAGREEIGPARLAAPSGMEAGQALRGWGMWARALGLWADRDKADGYLGRGQATSGAAIGADCVVNNRLLLGLAAGTTRTDLAWSGIDHDGGMDAVHTGIYAQARFNGLFARGAVSWARFSSSAVRPVNCEGFKADANADFKADLYSAVLSLGCQARLGQWCLEPMAGLDYQHLNEEGFSESGAGFLNFDIASRDTDSALLNLGLDATRRIWAGDWEIIPRLGISWQHQLADGRPGLKAAFAGYGSAPFKVYGAEFPAGLAVAEAGLSATIRPGLGFFAEYGFAFADDYQAQTLSAGLKISW